LHRLLLAATACSLALSAQEPVPVESPAGFARFQQRFGPDWTVWHGAHGVPYRVFGPGAHLLPPPGVQTLEDAREAVMRFVDEYADWLGVRSADLVEHHVGQGRFVLSLTYRQTVGGVPVWNAYVKFTFNRGDGGLAIFGSEAVPGLRVPLEPALDRNAAVTQFMKLTGWRPQLGHMHHDPHLEIAPGEDGVYRLAWKVTGEFTDRPEAWSLWIDAKTGAELRRESQIHYCGLGAGDEDDAPESAVPAPFVGIVQAWISPKPGGHGAANPPQVLPLANVRVDVPGVGFAYTDENGAFSIPYAGTNTMNATVTVANGRWWTTVTDDSGTPIQSQTVPLTPGVPGIIILNQTRAEYTTAQVNAVQYAGEIHDYVKRVVPTMTSIDAPVTIRVNINQSCNAYFSGSSINFYRLAGSCNNTASASVVAHEYGHSIDARNGGIGSTPRTPSEGIADVCSLYLLDDPNIGMDFYQTSRPGIRDGRNNLTHPLTGSQAVHNFGQPFMGWAWDVLTQARATYGNALGYQIAESALFESIALNPRDMLDYILDAYACDDDDSNLNNGTPHIDVFAKASLRRHFIRPVFHPIKFTHTPLTDQTDGASGFTIDAGVTTTIGTLTSVTLNFDPGTGTFTTIPMTNVGGNQWRATTPPVTNRRVVRYYISATNSTGNTYRVPAEVGDAFVFAVGSKTTLFADGFETSTSNWTFGSGWSRHTPIGRNYDPNVAASGSFVAGVNRSSSDERQPTSSATRTLTSTSINTTGRTGVRLRFKRWATNNNNGQCIVVVNGVNVQVAVNPTDQAWRTFDLDVSQYADNRANVQIRFDNVTTTSDSAGGFTIDDVELYALNTPCPALAGYSPGLAGVNGVPQLGTVGEPRLGNATFALTLTSAAPNAPLGWIIGAAVTNIPFLGGSIAAQPDVLVSLGTNAAGAANLTLPVPNLPSLIGQSLYTQAVVLDAAAVQGAAMSPAARLQICDQQ